MVTELMSEQCYKLSFFSSSIHDKNECYLFPVTISDVLISPKTNKSTTATVPVELLRQVWVGWFSHISENMVHVTFNFLVQLHISM